MARGSFQTLPPVGVTLILDKSFDCIPDLWAPRLGKNSQWLVQTAEQMVADALDIANRRVRVTNELSATNEIRLNLITDSIDEDQRSPMQLAALLIQKINDKNDPIHKKPIAVHVVKTEFSEKPFAETSKSRGGKRDSWKGGICVFAIPGEIKAKQFMQSPPSGWDDPDPWSLPEGWDDPDLLRMPPPSLALRHISEDVRSLSEVSDASDSSVEFEVPLPPIRQLSSCSVVSPEQPSPEQSKGQVVIVKAEQESPKASPSKKSFLRKFFSCGCLQPRIIATAA